MLKTIEAIQPTWGHGLSGSPEASITSSRSFDRMHYKKDIEVCVDQKIVSVQWMDDAFRLYFEGPQLVEIRRVDGLVEYNIAFKGANDFRETSGIQDTVLLKLGGREFVWERAALLKSLEGHLFRKVFVTPNMLFLYVSTIGILSVSALINLHSARDFLFWWPSD